MGLYFQVVLMERFSDSLVWKRTYLVVVEGNYFVTSTEEGCWENCCLAEIGEL